MLQLWLRAWHLYKDTVLSFFPMRYQGLLHYWHHIVDFDQCFTWVAVLSYDAQFCHRCTMQGLLFSTFDQQLYITTLDAMATKVSACRCFHCLHFNHEVIDCPFPPGALLKKDLALKKAAQGQQGWGNHQRHQQQHSLSWTLASSCPLSSTRAGRFASSTNQNHTPSPTADGSTSAGTVSRSTQLQSVILQVQLLSTSIASNVTWPATWTDIIKQLIHLHYIHSPCPK